MNDLYTLSSKISILINTIETAVTHIRQQHFWTTAHEIKLLSSLLADFLPLAGKVFDRNTQTVIIQYLKELTAAQASSDYVLLGDILEMKLLQDLYQLQGSLVSGLSFPAKDFFAENLKLLSENSSYSELCSKLLCWKKSVRENIPGYTIEVTNSGFLTLNRTSANSSHYFHSNQNPWTEGSLFADSYREENVFHYVIAGFGLGYHAVQMLQKDARYQVTVLEPDINVLGLALRYIDFSYILKEERFRLIYSPLLKELGNYTSQDDCKLIIHYPTMISMENEKVKSLLSEYFVQMSSVEEQKKSLQENFYYNMLRKDGSVDKIKNKFTGKTVIYLGGGPSSETKLPEIRRYVENHPDAVTICAGKVYRTLVAQDFIPDYVMITDAKPGLSWQLRDIPQTSAKLIYLSTASRHAVNVFCGETLIFFQKGFSESEDYASKHGLTLFETGGSVSTAAIDLSLQLGCRTLITAGIDLAYPENKSHAFGICGNIPGKGNYIHRKDIHGRDIITSPAFLIYHKWIENRIQRTNTEYINLTDGIAVQGMKNTDSLQNG